MPAEDAAGAGGGDRRRPPADAGGRVHQLRLLPGRAVRHRHVGGGRRPGRPRAARRGPRRSAGCPAGTRACSGTLRPGDVLPAEVTELRCGEALLLGQDALFYEPLPGCRRDACVLRAEVLEAYTRPAPRGRAAEARPGHRPAGSERGRGRASGSPVCSRSAARPTTWWSRSADGMTAPAVGSVVEMLPATKRWLRLGLLRTSR